VKNNRDCLFCETEACICYEYKNYTRYLFLTDHIDKLNLYNETRTLSTSEQKVWQMMYDQATEEQQTTGLLITFKPSLND